MPPPSLGCATNPMDRDTGQGDRALRFANGVAAAVGRTPLIKLKRASEETGCTILGKAEFMNPGQSVKDRAALFIIQDAVKRGTLRPGGTVVEGTAGNTGIGLTVVGNALGFRSVIVIPETQSQEKKDALRLLGAQLVEVPALPYKNPNNYVHYSQRLAEALAKTEPNGAIWANQWDNTANRQAHIETTAEEIWADTDGKVDGFVSAVGSGGTLGGVLRRPQGQAQGHPDRARRRARRRALQLLHDRRAQVGGLLHHRGHRPGPHHQEHRGRRGRSRLPDPGRGIGRRLLPAAAGGRAVHGRLDRRQRRRRHPARQGAGARPHHRHAALRLRHALPVEALQPGRSCDRRTCRCPKWLVAERAAACPEDVRRSATRRDAR